MFHKKFKLYILYFPHLSTHAIFIKDLDLKHFSHLRDNNCLSWIIILQNIRRQSVTVIMPCLHNTHYIWSSLLLLKHAVNDDKESRGKKAIPTLKEMKAEWLSVTRRSLMLNTMLERIRLRNMICNVWKGH